MGLKPSFKTARAYVDTNIFIYAVEGVREPARMLFAAIEAGEIVAVTSELTVAELLVAPLRQGQASIVDLYLELLTPGSSPNLLIVPVDRLVLVRSAQHRAERGGRLPDAIHVATALAAHCQFILSEDRTLALPHALPRRSLTDILE
ncbi:MAG: type II toxin-antitoxin system VapC family toxin [Hyphomicrobiaceae bacterium]|nr:type II toxin-antitoxin system VapC family toxin [Hyphomicrobiaceae bacterium]